MTSKGSGLCSAKELSEFDDRPETYEFIPENLRHHFNVGNQTVGDEQAEQELVRHARLARSAHLVGNLFTLPSPPAPAQLLYSNAIERAITARMTFSRAREELEKYFTDVTTKVKQLENQYPGGVFDMRDVKIPTLVQTQRRIVNVCQGCLSDCDIYLGMYEAFPSPPAAPSTPIIRFVACSSKSAMLHKRLECSTRLVEQPQTDDTQSCGQRKMCITMQAMAATEPIVVDDVADLAAHEIHRFSPSDTLTGPFSCFPIVVEELNGSSRTIGVLSVDACRKAQRLLPQSMSVDALHAFLLRMELKDAAVQLKKAKMDGARFLALTEIDVRHKPSFQRLKVATRNRLLEIIRALQHGSRIHLPDTSKSAPPFTRDDDALEFLTAVSELSGKFLANYRRVFWIQEITSITRSSECTAYDVYDVLIRAITRSIEPVERVSVWKISNKKAETTATSMPGAPQWEIDVVASTSVPGDRISPFINGQEWKMKRISLYKENDEAVRAACERGRGAHTPLMRGGIVNVLPNAVVSSTPADQPCESATYHVSWSDRSTQSLSWSELRQLLPIRNMNAKHFQLQQLCQRLQEDIGENSASKSIKMKNPNGVVLILRDASRPEAVKYALEVDFTADFEPPQEFCDFLERTVAIAQQALECIRGREARLAKRKRAVAKNSSRFQSIGLNPSGDALRALQDIVSGMFDDITDSLPGVHVQIAELQSNGDQLKFTFTGKGSTILGCSFNRGQGVSFKCLETKQPLVVGSTSKLRSLLQRFGALRSQPQALDAAFPFIFVPLFHEDCYVGVLSADSFQNVPKGRDDEEHPEAGTLEFLTSLAKLLASVIYAKRRSYALYELQQSCQEPLRSPQQLVFYACRALKDVLIGAWKVRVVEIDGVRGKSTLVYEFSESERERALSWLFNVVRPMAFRWKELCTDTIVSHLNQLQPGQEHTSESVIKLLSAIREGEQEHQNEAERYHELVAEEKLIPSNASRKTVIETEKAKLFERQTADKYFLLMEASSTCSDEVALGADRITNAKYIAHSMKVFLGATTCLFSDVQAMARSSSKIFLTVSGLPPFHASCDQIYLQRVASITSKYMTALQDRVRRSRERTIALHYFKDLCQKTLASDGAKVVDTTANTRGGRYQHKLSPTKEVENESLLQLQRDTIALIERALGSPNVYFGVWEPALRILRYTSASKTSIMAGKKLKHGYGVSFLSMEKQIPIVITSRDAANEDEASLHFRKLRYFTNEPLEGRKWPFIVVPVGNLGVLTLNNMETYEQESQELQPELGVVDFLRKIGQSFAEVLTATRERTIEQRQILRNQALVRVMSACENFKLTASSTGAASLYLPHLVIQQIENAFNGVDAYIGTVDPLCGRIRFICASSKSNMEGRTVDTAQSTSFRVFSTQRTVAIPQLPQYFKQQEVLQQHDTEYGQKLKYFGSAKTPQGPFVCVPIPFVGVLSVDTFPGAAGGVFSPVFPEDGVVVFLEKVANFLGENIRTVAANDARKLLPTLFRGNRTTFPTLFKDILQVISRNLLAVFELQALRFKRDEQTGQWAKKTLLAHLRRSNNTENETGVDDDKELLLVQSLEERFCQQRRTADKSGEVSDESKLLLSPVHQLSKWPEVLVVHCCQTRDAASDNAELVPTVLVLHRVKGATWMYDEDFLLSILPLINALIALANVRVEGIVARRHATRKIDDLCLSLEGLASTEAIQFMYTTMLPAALEILARSMSPDNCDVYLGQREFTTRTKSEASHLQLRFVAASSRSLMQNVTINLEGGDNSFLAVVQCLQNQKSSVVELSREYHPVRSLTTKPAHRVFITVPIGDNHVLCSDSLGQEAFIPGKRQVVEPDIILFFKASASRLQETILSVRHRFSYYQLQNLTSRPHSDLRLFVSTILDGLRRDLVNIHSQQVLTLGQDFTSSFRLEAWHRASTRRVIKTLPQHFCSMNGCECAMINHEIHSEESIVLPMTNVPRTLDTSRSRMQPVEGTEKHGTFTCACLATMLDSSAVSHGGDAKLALCVFSHDSKAKAPREKSRIGRRAMIPHDYGDGTAFFTNYQRQYFFALAAVVADVYTYVFRSCALETFSAELFMVLQEYLDARDGVVVRFLQGENNSEVENTSGIIEDVPTNDEGYGSTASIASTAQARSKSKKAMVLFSQQQGKIPLGYAVRGKLERKARQFEASNAPVTIFMTKKAAPASRIKDAQATTKSSTSTVVTSKAKTTKRRGLFGGRTLFRYGKKKNEEEEKKAAEQEQLMKAAPELETLSPSRAQQLRHEKVSLHVFLRGLEFQGRHDIVVFTVEKQSVQAASAVEKLTRQIKSRSDVFAAQMIANPPRGDEEINAKRFCSQSRSRGGGGFLLLSLLHKAQENFQQIEGAFGGAMRQFLTGAQSTARDTRSNVSEDLGVLLGTTSEKNDGKATITPTTALIRVSLVACGTKREAVLALSQTNLLEEYLRLQVGSKLLQLDPTDKKVWGVVGRARTLLRSYDGAVHTLAPRPEEGTKPVGAKVEVNAALHSLLDLLLTQSAVVRYLKHLESEMACEQRQLRDEPATKLQCFIRQSQARTKLKKRRRESHAALAIQCAFRQHLARRRALFMKWTRAATTVQRAYRRKRQKAKGSRPRRFTAQLLSASRSTGRSPSVVANEAVDPKWSTDMAAFGTLQQYLASKVGREHIKKEEELMWKHQKQLEKDRAQLPRDEALREDVGDIFELLDDTGRGELSRDRTAALITRLHVPLNEEEIADVVAMMDSDGSGGISLDEFMRWFVHEFPILQQRAPRVCGVVTQRDWKWVIEQSARSAILKRWRAMRAGAMSTAPGESATVINTGIQHGGAIKEEGEVSEQE